MIFWIKTLCFTIALSVCVIDSYSQSHYTIDLPEDIAAVDIKSLDGVYTHLITQNGIYEINGRSLRPLTLFDEIEITRNAFPSFDNLKNKYPSYPILHGGYLSIITKDSIVISHMDLVLHNVHSNNESTLMDTKEGRLEIKNKRISYNQNINDNSTYSQEIKSIIERHNISDVLYAYMSQDSSYRFLTKKKCFSYTEGNLSIDYEINTDNTEELIAISCLLYTSPSPRD